MDLFFFDKLCFRQPGRHSRRARLLRSPRVGGLPDRDCIESGAGSFFFSLFFFTD